MLLHNNLNSAKERYLFLLMVNLIIVAVFVTFIAAYSASQITTYSNKARFAEALTKITSLKSKISIDYFYLGYWPPSQILEDNSSKNRGIIKKIIFDGKGSINIYFNDNQPEFSDQILSFTAAHNPQSELSSLLWVCGYASLPKNFESMGTNISNIDRIKLPRTCKL